MTVYVSQAARDSVMFPRQILVIDSQQVQDRGIEIVNHQRILCDLKSQFIRHSVADARFDTGAREECCKTIGIVITSLCPLLEHRHTAEFGAPNNQRIFQQAALSEVVDECSCRLVQDMTVNVVLLPQCLMTVPVESSSAGVSAIEQLHESHSLFQQSTSEDAVSAEGSTSFILRVISCIHAKNVFWF